MYVRQGDVADLDVLVGPLVEQLDAANLGDNVLGQDSVARDGLDLDISALGRHNGQQQQCLDWVGCGGCRVCRGGERALSVVVVEVGRVEVSFFLSTTVDFPAGASLDWLAAAPGLIEPTDCNFSCSAYSALDAFLLVRTASPAHYLDFRALDLLTRRPAECRACRACQFLQTSGKLTTTTSPSLNPRPS